MLGRDTFSSLTPVVLNLLIVNLALFLFFALLGNSQFGSFLYYLGILDPSAVVQHFQVWRILSYAFIHDTSSPLHVVFNGLLLYMVGPELENRWGSRAFLGFCLAAALGGGICVCLGYLLGLTRALVLGFSGVSLGLLIAWGITFPNRQMFLFGLVPLTGKHLVWLTVAMEILYAVSANGISSAAHIGGMVVGFIFTLGLWKPERIRSYLKGLKKRRSSDSDSFRFR